MSSANQSSTLYCPPVQITGTECQELSSRAHRKANLESQYYFWSIGGDSVRCVREHQDIYILRNALAEIKAYLIFIFVECKMKIDKVR
jgi:hypothetical protein